MSQIEYLTSMLYSQLGITQSLLDGTAEENVSLNYMSRTIEPVISAITDELERKFFAGLHGIFIDLYIPRTSCLHLAWTGLLTAHHRGHSLLHFVKHCPGIGCLSMNGNST